MQFFNRDVLDPNVFKGLKLKKTGYFIGIAITWLSSSAIALAQVPSSIEFLPTPPDQGAPDGRQRGGATRGECLAFQDLAAIVPTIRETEPTVRDIVWSQTTEAYPQFFFEIPTDLTTEIPLEFVIQDSNGEYAVRQQFSVDAAAGILAVPAIGWEPSAEQPGLVEGETYHWTFAIYCDENRPSASVSVTGTVQRVADFIGNGGDSNPEADLTPEAQFDLLQQYAAAGIWHEAFALAIALQMADPQNEIYIEVIERLREQAGLVEALPMEDAPMEAE